MSYTTEFVDDGRGVIHIGQGIVTDADILDGAKQTLAAAKRGMPLRYGLADATGIERFAIHADEIRDIARANISISRIIRTMSVAIVAPADHAYGMARMWEAHVDATGWETRVFRKVDEARAWLNDCGVGDPRPIEALAFTPRNA